ncbi:hypothetical protein FK498_16365 [Elioraea sp. Yellowstone]|jgi:hypothetical protein|uniref:hypothetical protein n=1 Tax=Elioraea sp. Yellowstone TaxID=2592070 RepID=UPI00114ED5A3|nr:hypothetical protein [Elioraea sp. Yellowstone]TQF76713.1 hypothetical protein FK498_16365 [Elioraea sp. Yellowstone]
MRKLLPTPSRPSRTDGGTPPIGALLAAALPVLRRAGWPLGLSWAVLTAIAALSPSVGWMGKQVVDGLAAAEGDLAALLVAHGLAFALLFTLLSLLEVADKPAGKWVEARLVIALQDSYLARRRVAHVTDDAAMMLYGSDEAKRGLKVLIDEVPKLVFTLVSVSLWQAALAPQWLPFMLAALLPAFLWLGLLAPPVRSHALAALEAQVVIAGATAAEAGLRLKAHQHRWLRASVVIDLFKGLGEKGLVWLIWASFATAVAVFLLLMPASGLGRDMTPGEFLVTMVNLRLFVGPLSKFGKIVMHFAQARPALARALGLAGAERNLNGGVAARLRPAGA